MTESARTGLCFGTPLPQDGLTAQPRMVSGKVCLIHPKQPSQNYRIRAGKYCAFLFRFAKLAPMIRQLFFFSMVSNPTGRQKLQSVTSHNCGRKISAQTDKTKPSTEVADAALASITVIYTRTNSCL